MSDECKTQFLSVIHFSIYQERLHACFWWFLRNHTHTHKLTLCVLVCVFSVSAQTLEGCEILLGPEVTYGPSGLDLFCPVAMTVAHCAEVDAENWNIQLKRKTQDGKWEVSRRTNTCQVHYSASDLSLAQQMPLGPHCLSFLLYLPISL